MRAPAAKVFAAFTAWVAERDLSPIQQRNDRRSVTDPNLATVNGHRRVGIERGGYAITPSGSSGKNDWCCFGDLGAGLRGQRRYEVDVRTT